jgi:hypothetical protein
VPEGKESAEPAPRRCAVRHGLVGSEPPTLRGGGRGVVPVPHCRCRGRADDFVISVDGWRVGGRRGCAPSTSGRARFGCRELHDECRQRLKTYGSHTSMT